MRISSAPSRSDPVARSALPVVILREDADGSVAVLAGADRSDAVRAAAATLERGTSGLRREGDGMVARIPAGAGDRRPDYVFGIDAVPPVTELAALLRGLAPLAQALEGARDAAPRTPALASELAGDLARARARRIGARVPILLNGLVSRGVASGGSAVRLAAGRPGRAWHHDRRHGPLEREMRNLLRAMDAAGLGAVRSDRSGGSLEVDADLICQRMGGARLDVLRPASGTGLALLLVDADGIPDGLADVASGLAGPDLLRRRRPGRGRVAAMALAAAALALPFVPVPVRLPATGEAVPREARTVALPVDAFLREVLVSPGDVVRVGDLLARFDAPQLEERLGQARLTVRIEMANAQEALSQNDIAGVQVAEARQAVAEAEIAALEGRLAALAPRAPIAGRVVGALPPASKGRFFPLGEAVATIQDGRTFDLLLVPSSVDAPSIETGQTGVAQFRGLPGEAFPVTVETPPAPGPAAGDGTRNLAFRARVEGDHPRLATGLSGFARIEVGTAPLALVWGRYAIEWTRLRAWTLFGLGI